MAATVFWPAIQNCALPEVVIGEPATLNSAGAVSATEVTVPPPPPEPFAAAVTCPSASTVMSALVYDPAVTPEVACATVGLPETPSPLVIVTVEAKK